VIAILPRGNRQILRSSRCTLQEINDLLSTPDFQEIAEEYERTKKKVGRYSNWYSLYGGPRNIGQLAKLLNRGAAYALLYRSGRSRRTPLMRSIES